jgi:SnoaL-like protein
MEAMTDASTRQDLIETVDRLFVATDRKDWDAVTALFAERVRFDMTSLAGGAPAVLTPAQIVDGWRTGLADVAVVHHHSGNHLVTLRADDADVFCYATATHFRPEAEKKLTTFVGSYDLHLVRAGGAWRIEAFRFNVKYVI